MKPKISIIIPTKNGEKYIGECLTRVYKQEPSHDFEVIAIDSGSRDKTLEIISRFPVRLEKINPEEFGHGKTRNLGARISQGKYLVYLTQDAIPANEKWLEYLVKSMELDEKIAGAYSRNLPKQGCYPSEARYISKGWGRRKEIKGIEDYKKNRKKAVFFSNSSSCIRKEVWEKFPFNEELIQTEDQDWSKRVLEAGYRIAYEPRSMVYHSHNHPPGELLRKYFDAGWAHRQIFGDHNNVYLPLIPFFAIAVTLLDMNFMRGKYPLPSIIRWLPIGIGRHIVEATGFWLGLHSKYLPKGLVKRLTYSGVPRTNQGLL
jgi:rhamnosyltransferase